ncbi:MAG: aldehyde dehydrogenase (NADP(+)) [Terracidiphilus sp.]
MELTGQSFLGNRRGARSGAAFQAVNPQTATPLPPVYHTTSPAEIDAAVQLAAEAFASYANASGKARAAFLRRAADGFITHQQELAERAHLETALPMPRLLGEVARTANQLRLFASVAEEGSWVQARIDPPLPDRQPIPRPDIRSMLRPLGPVAVFGASNFPLAFSVAGGDTASALAAGCPVIVKAHAAHPGTSEIAAHILCDAVTAEGLHPGVFTMLYDAGIEVGAALVKHPLIRAVAFTGSLRAGRALMDLAAARPDPIPCFAEMSSGNPVFILPGALKARPEELARTIFNSFTLGAGQQCTKPGILLLPDAPERATFSTELQTLVAQASPFTLLTSGIAREYARATDARGAQATLAAAAPATPSGPTCAANAKLFSVSLENFLQSPAMAEEIFGPDTLLVHCENNQGFLDAARSLTGHLTASVFGTVEDLLANRDLLQILEQKAGRLIVNGVPTGVDVGHAMIHGGPYPSTSDARFTSVGSLAIFRFARPVCYQNFPQALLPLELQDNNPLGIARLRDGKLQPASV